MNQLLRLCLTGASAERWEDLLQRIQPVIANMARRAALSRGPASPQDIDDIVQQTCLKLGGSRLATISRAALESEAAAFAYIKVMALNAARDHFAWHRRRPAIEESALPAPIAELAAADPTDADRGLLLAQIDSALNANVRDRSIFWLYYRQGYTAKEISQIPHLALSVKGVESLLGRLTESVRRRMGGEKQKGKVTAEAS